MFPLPGVFLFPGQLMPLHIFEPRYRQMVEDSLDGPGQIVLATVRESDRPGLSGNPPIVPIAGLGEIARHERLDDGRFLVWLAGVARVRVDEVESERLYRRASVERLVDAPASVADETRLRPELTAAISSRTGHDFEAETETELPLGALADVLAQCLAIPEQVMIGLHGETDVAERARKALAAHGRFPSRRRD